MAKCDYCGSTIIVGGVRQGEKRYCNQKCHQSGMLVALSERIDPVEIQNSITRIHQGACPKCNGPGPVDVSTSYKIWSALVLTSWSNKPEISCRSCGRKKQIEGALFSLIAGWWGFPWGLILTPVQITRNVIGLSRSYDPFRPSPQLESAVRLMLASRIAQNAQG